MTRDRWLLITGLALVGAALLGGLVTGPAWGPHMGEPHMGEWHHLMMGGWGRISGNSPIEGAEAQEIVASDFAFSPAEFTVTAGEPVNLTLVNRGAVPHDLVIGELDVEVEAGVGQRSTVGFVPSEPGSYPFVCTYPGHAGAGMRGTLMVVEP